MRGVPAWRLVADLVEAERLPADERRVLGRIAGV
jgi:hypothetical protein